MNETSFSMVSLIFETFKSWTCAYVFVYDDKTIFTASDIKQSDPPFCVYKLDED